MCKSFFNGGYISGKKIRDFWSRLNIISKITIFLTRTTARASERPKRVKYQNTKYRSFGIVTEPILISVNLVRFGHPLARAAVGASLIYVPYLHWKPVTSVLNFGALKIWDESNFVKVKS